MFKFKNTEQNLNIFIQAKSMGLKNNIKLSNIAIRENYIFFGI